MGKKNWFTVTVSEIKEREDKAPYQPFEGHTLTISPDGTLWMAGEDGRVLSVAAGGYGGFEFKRLEAVKPGDQR